jgi:hypothetical protein
LSKAQPYLGYVTRQEAGTLADALNQALDARSRGGARPQKGIPGKAGGPLKQISAAARECADTEFDLMSFVG